MHTLVPEATVHCPWHPSEVYVGKEFFHIVVRSVRRWVRRRTGYPKAQAAALILCDPHRRVETLSDCDGSEVILDSTASDGLSVEGGEHAAIRHRKDKVSLRKDVAK